MAKKFVSDDLIDFFFITSLTGSGPRHTAANEAAGLIYLVNSLRFEVRHVKDAVIFEMCELFCYT